MTAFDYEQDVGIDGEALDVEWLQQAELMRRYSVHAADMKRGVDEAKERLDVLHAQLDRDVRKNPAAFGIDKITESVVQSTIVLQERYQQLSSEHTNARYEHDIAMAAVRAIDQKKTALENLVRLLTASYFAGPQAPRDLSREWVDRQERREANARIRISQHTEEGR